MGCKRIHAEPNPEKTSQTFITDSPHYTHVFHKHQVFTSLTPICHVSHIIIQKKFRSCTCNIFTILYPSRFRSINAVKL